MFGINQKDLLFRDMRKLVIFLVLVFGVLQFVHGQPAFVEICQGDSYTWYFDTPPAPQVIIRAMKPGSITYDTINNNQIVLSPQEYTIYDIISINGNANVCNESLIIDVISISPTILINNQNLSISVTGNAQVFIHITDNNDALLYHYQWENDVSIDNISPGDYKVYITTQYSNCRVTIPITIP